MKRQLSTLKKRIIPILKRNDVIRAGIFGSYARGEATKKSDIDILIKYNKKKSLLQLVGLKLEFEDTLGKNVDLIEYSIIHPLLKERIRKEEVKIL